MHTFITVLSNVFYGIVLWLLTYMAYRLIIKRQSIKHNLHQKYEDYTETYWISFSVYNDLANNIQVPIPKTVYDRLFHRQRTKKEVSYQRHQSAQDFNVPKIKKLSSYNNFKSHVNKRYQTPQIKSYLR